MRKVLRPKRRRRRAASAGSAVDLSVKQKPTLTPADMVNQSKEYFTGMGAVVKRIQTLQDQAKREKDIIRLNCVTDKLVQARVNVNIAEQSMATMQESIARNDEGEADPRVHPPHHREPEGYSSRRRGRELHR